VISRKRNSIAHGASHNSSATGQLSSGK